MARLDKSLLRLDAVRVEGATVKDAGKFTLDETIGLTPEKGVVTVSGSGPEFRLDYGFDAAAVAASRLLGNPGFVSGKYAVQGALRAVAADGTVLAVVPVTVTR